MVAARTFQRVRPGVVVGRQVGLVPTGHSALWYKGKRAFERSVQLAPMPAPHLASIGSEVISRASAIDHDDKGGRLLCRYEG
jgi:hypothetical protein